MNFTDAIKFGILAGVTMTFAASTLEVYGIEQAYEKCAAAAVVAFLALATIKIYS